MATVVCDHVPNAADSSMPNADRNRKASLALALKKPLSMCERRIRKDRSRFPDSTYEEECDLLDP